MINPTPGQVAYAAYGATTNHLNHQGLPMPPWDDLGDTIRRAWENAARAVHADRNAIARQLADLHDAHDALRRRHADFAETCASHSADRAAEQVAAETLVERLQAMGEQPTGDAIEAAIRDYETTITHITGL